MKKKITIFLSLLALSAGYLHAQCNESFNLASSSKVYVSSTWELPQYGWSLAFLTDGNRLSTGSSMGWTTTAPDVTINQEQWVVLKMNAVHNIKTVQLFPRSDAGHIGEAFPVDFTIAVSEDSTTWTTVVTKTGYAKPMQTADGEIFNFAPTMGKYVRLHATLLGTTPENGTNVYRLQLAEFEIYESCSTSVEALKQTSGIKVYPTQVINELSIETNGSFLKAIKIVDVTGTVKSNINISERVSKYNLKAEFLPGGIYFLQCKLSDGTISTIKIVKQ
jgi:hypothetical protein